MSCVWFNIFYTNMHMKIILEAQTEAVQKIGKATEKEVKDIYR